MKNKKTNKNKYTKIYLTENVALITHLNLHLKLKQKKTIKNKNNFSCVN